MSMQTPPAQPQIDAINALMEKAADAIKNYDPQKPITLVYHDDTDGLSSGAIMTETLSRMNRKTEHYCMEQIYPVPIIKIYEKAKGPIFIMDLGVGPNYMSLICQQTRDRPTIILDHHGRFEKNICSDDEKIFNINCNKYQISGDCYSSASTLVYMFAQKLENISDLAQLAVLGAFGDRNHMHGEEEESFSKYGLDYKIFEQAKNVTVSDVHVYKVKLSENSEFVLMEQLMDDVLLLGSIGYKKSLKISRMKDEITGPRLGIELLLKGYEDEFIDVLKDLRAKRDAVYGSLIKKLQTRKDIFYCETDTAVFFNAEQAFKGLGVKTIGDFCTHLLKESMNKKFDFINPMKYLMGAQPLEPIPFGKDFIKPFNTDDALKISIRAPNEVGKKIKTGDSLAVTALLEFVNPAHIGSTHELRGATIVTRETINEFLAKCDDCLKGKQCGPMELPELEISVKS